MGLYLLNLSHDPRVLNQFPDLQEVKDTSLLADGAVRVFFGGGGFPVQCVFVIT